MVERVYIKPNGPCTYCGESDACGGWIPDGEGGSSPCPVCGTPYSECIICNGDCLDELVTMLPCPECLPLSKRPGELPPDYEPCGDCGFDHDYDYMTATAWRTENPGSYS